MSSPDGDPLSADFIPAAPPRETPGGLAGGPVTPVFAAAVASGRDLLRPLDAIYPILFSRDVERSGLQRRMPDRSAFPLFVELSNGRSFQRPHAS